jgi:LPXTG-motif cell wall-anchored protein
MGDAMKTARVLASTAAAAVMALAPQAAFADDYGEVAPNEGGTTVTQPAGGAAGTSDVAGQAGGVLPSTGSTALDTVIGGAGLLLLLGGGATLVAARRKQQQVA